MLFNSFIFVGFFIAVYGLYVLCNHKWQNRLLLVASYLFYASWDWRFLSLIIFSTLVDYICSIQIYESTGKPRKKVFLYTSLIVNLGLLGIFKYFGFFAENFAALASLFGWYPGDITLTVVLPVGISFYTFQTLSYTIDVYRNRLKPERNLLQFALYVAFFPQLVAGPIERAWRLLPQIQNPRTITKKTIQTGLWMVAWGYFLKVFVADNLGNIVDTVFAKQSVISGGEALVSLYAFAFQIFGDFAGYSAIAIGVGHLLGIKLMTNFLFPYFVTNPRDFWANWHISLSTWLRDYLYIPLGGNRGSNAQLYRNLFLTMLLGGLWHGAAWTFVIWGIYQGGILIIHRLIKPYLEELSEYLDLSDPARTFVRVLNIIFFFQVTCIGWLIFRAESIGQIQDMLWSIFFNMSDITAAAVYYGMELIFFTGLLLLVQLFQIRFNSKNTLLHFPKASRYAIYVMMYYLVIIWGEFGSREFIYFQF